MTQKHTPRRMAPGRMGQREFVFACTFTNTTAPHPNQENGPAFPILARHWPGFPFPCSEARK